MKKITIFALLIATTLAGCAYRPSTAKCFNYAPTEGDCTFKPVSSGPWEEVVND